MSDHFRPPAIVSTSPDTVQRDVGSFQDAALGALFVGGKLAFPKVTSNTLAYINFALYEKSLVCCDTLQVLALQTGSLRV